MHYNYFIFGGNNMSILNEIAIKYGTDKSSEIHNYCVKYEKYLPFQRNEKIKILEIGVLNSESLKMWSEYFYNATIIGIDINDKCKQYENNNIFIEIGNQNDKDFLKMVSNKYNGFNLIIDDGSHYGKDIIFSFEILFEYLVPNGIYIVEDSATSYWSYYNENKYYCIEYFKNLIDDVNFNGVQNFNFHNVNARREDVLKEQLLSQNIKYKFDIESINFLNSLIIINKYGT